MDSTYLLKDPSTLPTPALLVYREKVQDNTNRAIALAGGPGRLRPHIKTHKTKQIIKLQQRAGIDKFKCATLAEAELLAQCDVKDILIAYPIVGPNRRRLTELCRKYPASAFKLIVDHEQSAEELSRSLAAAGIELETLLDLDVGMQRTGVVPDERAVALYQAIDGLPGLIPGGLHAYDGHNRLKDLSQRCTQAAQGAAGVMKLKKTLEGRGIPVPRVVLGAMPTLPCHAKRPDLEISPGTCFLYDWGSQKEFPDLPFRPAALLLCRIVSKPGPGLITLDLGSKAIATDLPGARGIILNLEGAEPLRQDEEHWVFRVQDAGRLPIGELLYVLPTHICLTFVLYQEVAVIGPNGQVEEFWPVEARNRRITV